MSNEIVKSGVYDTPQSFENAQRMAKALCSSTLVPTAYQNNISNTLVALEMSHRLGASPLMVMQNLNVIHGKPSWGSAFIIALINSCGRFEPLKFKLDGQGDERSCIAYTADKKTGVTLDSPPVSIWMAKKEGWYTKSGSKWPTMPELMLRYRAAAFFGRLYCPEIMLGMQTSEEVLDVDGGQPQSNNTVAKINAVLSSSPVSTLTDNLPAQDVKFEETDNPPAQETPTNDELV